MKTTNDLTTRPVLETTIDGAIKAPTFTDEDRDYFDTLLNTPLSVEQEKEIEREEEHSQALSEYAEFLKTMGYAESRLINAIEATRQVREELLENAVMIPDKETRAHFWPILRGYKACLKEIQNATDDIKWLETRLEEDIMSSLFPEKEMKKEVL